MHLGSRLICEVLALLLPTVDGGDDLLPVAVGADEGVEEWILELKL
jgi:hypothetical protein